jgi:hypothetical protein
MEMLNRLVAIFKLPFFLDMDGVLMTYQEIVRTIQTLPLTERLSLLEVLAQSLQVDIEVKDTYESSLVRVRGIFKADGPAPTDQELEDNYTNYLIEKYT